MTSSRIPGFYKLSIEQRERLLSEQLGLGVDALAALGQGGISLDVADKMIENVIGVFALPFAVGLNLQLNGKDYLVPMVVEEPSVVAAASNASRMVREGGGFTAESDDPVMIS